MPIFFKELLLTAIITGVILYIHSDWYDNCIANTATIFNRLDPSLNCYEIYDSAVQSEVKQNKPVLISAATHASLTVICFIGLLYWLIHVCGADSLEELMLRWGLAIVAALIDLVIQATTAYLFYCCCKRAS